MTLWFRLVTATGHVVRVEGREKRLTEQMIRTLNMWLEQIIETSEGSADVDTQSVVAFISLARPFYK